MRAHRDPPSSAGASFARDADAFEAFYREHLEFVRKLWRCITCLLLASSEHFAGSTALEQALAYHGVTADVTYLPPGERCEPGRYPASASHTRGLQLGVSADEFTVTLPPGAISDGETLVVAASVAPIENGVSVWVTADVVAGAIGTCQPEPRPDAAVLRQ